MSRRLLSNDMLKSERVNRLSGNAERTWVRWMLHSDKNGVAPANLEELRGLIYPTKPRLSMTYFSQWVQEIYDVGLVLPRKGKDGKPLVKFYNFEKYNGKLNFGKTFDVDDQPEGMSSTHSGYESDSSEGMSPTDRGVSVELISPSVELIEQKSPTILAKPTPDVDVKKMERNDRSELCSFCHKNPCPFPKVCENKKARAALESGTPPVSPVQPVSAKRTPAGKRKVGFDPYSILPWDGWTAEQITEVVNYHWAYLPTTDEEPFWRDKTNSEEFFKRNFEKMASQVKPIPGKKPKKSARVEPVQRIHDPNCAVCSGDGIDALRPFSLCACVRFKNAEGQFVSYYDYQVLNKKVNKFFEEDFAKEIPSMKRAGLPEGVHA